MVKRAAGFLIFRRYNSEVQYLMLKASYGSFHWTPPKGRFRELLSPTKTKVPFKLSL